MIIDHICFAVKDIRKGIEEWRSTFGYHQFTEQVTNSRQQVKVVFLAKPGSIDVKLIEPMKENKNIMNFVDRGGGFHHLCFKCNDIESSIEELSSKGVMTMVPPQPGEAFENEKIAFLLTKFGVNVELIDTDKRAGKL